MDKFVLSIIDPPITPYSSAEDIRSWLLDLEKMPDTAQVRKEKQDAMQLLEEVIALDKSN